MTVCDNCNYRIDDDDFCLKYSRYNAIEREKLMDVLSSGRCAEKIDIPCRIKEGQL